jgi:hypothetical protein
LGSWFWVKKQAPGAPPAFLLSISILAIWAG